jgi:SDR family mycofactocin-dependent oxidoreductase
MGKLDGKVAVITGGARGQGRAHAVTLARHGANVVVCDLAAPLEFIGYPHATQADLDETVRLVEDLDRRCIAIKADVRDSGAMKGVAETAMGEFGRLDILCANAGICDFESAWEMSDAQWQQTIDINLTGVWKSCRAVIPHMIAGGRGGAIVITSSVAGLKGLQGLAHYVSAKHGIVGLMRVLAIELAQHAIRVNTVHPTGVITPMGQNENIMDIMQRFPQLATGSTNLLPVPAVDPEDISNAIAWLVSDEARYVTGVTLPIDAGATQR